MNKKTLFAAPLAVLAMGLTACNKGWPSKTIDEADEIGKKIVADAGWNNPSTDVFNACTAKMSSRTYMKMGKAHMDNVQNSEYFIDATNCYSKYIEKESNTSEGSSGSIEVLGYYTFADGKGYDLTKHDGEDPEYDYTGEYYDNVTKEQVASKINEQAKEKYMEAKSHCGVNDFMAAVKTSIENSKNQFEQQYEGAEKLSYTYSLSSKNEKSLKINIEAKVWNYKAPTNSSNEVQLDSISYEAATIQMTVEDCLFTSYSMSSNGTGKIKAEDDKEYDAQIIMEQKINFARQTPSRDSINLNDYVITKAAE